MTNKLHHAKMARYRGKHNGKTRGKYVKTEFLYNPESLSETCTLEEQLDHFLSRQGYFINSAREETYTEESSPYPKVMRNTYAYHMGGATIGMTAKVKETKLYNDYSIYLKLVSNETMDDIIQKITGKFPVLKKIGTEENRHLDCL